MNERWEIQSGLSSKMAKAFEWDKWLKEIPAIPFKEGWKIKVIPPFGAAVIRFCIVAENADISVYLDCYEQLGCWNHPYWEIYPAENGDVERFFMEDVDGLLDGIQRSIDSVKEKDVI